MNGLSQTLLGNELGISRNKIASYESGVVEPNASTFLKISKYFSINPSEFLESILSENPSDYFVEDLEPDAINQKYVKDQVDDFIIQNNEMTKS